MWLITRDDPLRRQLAVRAQGKCTAGQLVNPGMTQASLSVPLVAPMTEYGDRINQLDINITKSIKWRNFNIQPKFDFFNAAEPLAGDGGARLELRHGRLQAAVGGAQPAHDPDRRDREVVSGVS